ncbi:MAG: hypothetical protein ACTSP0_05555 [Alphaproteobacteria bacterium]
MANKPVMQAKPRYPIPGIAIYFVAGLFLIAGVLALVWYVAQFSSEYDYTDPDMAFLERIVLSSEPGRGDFTSLNGGDWQALCLIGWQGDPAKAITAAKLPQALAEALLDEYGAADKNMDASEFVIVYTDKSGAAKSLRHPHGFAFAREGAAVCTTLAKPVLRLPAGG